MAGPDNASDGRASHRNLLFVSAGALVVVIGVVVVPVLMSHGEAWQDSATFVGDASCASCHAAHAETFAHTAHAHTSAPANAATVHGPLAPGANVFQSGNPGLSFMIEQRDGGVFQTAVLRQAADRVLTRSERMDIVVGSGRKGQTYLYWEEDRLFQLPISYWGERNAWVNSPGFIDGEANFERPIIPRCLECHATTFAANAPPPNAYDRHSVHLGISCEKCHGPGSEHVARYRSARPPASPEDAAIINPARLSRDRQTDLCALCHAGLGQAHTPALSYRPGETLAEHLTFPRQPAGVQLDVHASQVQLMERSRCYQQSPAMTCVTCHNVHQPERDLVAMAAKCLQCHQPDDCGEVVRHGVDLTTQCVTCHMPLEQTSQIVIADGVGQTMQPKVRNHHIAVYPTSPPAAP